MARGRERLLKGLALAMAAFGLLLVGAYAWSVYSVASEADRSIIFWYSPFLMFGLFLIGAAVAFGVLARIMRRERDWGRRQEAGRSDDGQA